MRELRLVPFASFANQFEAQIFVARLGAEGVVCQLRGACSMYPTGPVELLVDGEDLDRARELLLIDEVEAVFDDTEPPAARAEPAAGHRWLAWTVAVMLIAAVGLRLLSWLWLAA